MPANNTIILNMQSSDTLEALKGSIKDSVGTPVRKQQLIFDGRPLEGLKKQLQSFKLTNGSVVYMFARDHKESRSFIICFAN